MRFSTLVFATLLSLGQAHPVERRNDHTELEIPATSSDDIQTSYGKPFAVYQPKAFIISMFKYERDPWLRAMDLVHNTNYTICQMTTGEGEINAASSFSVLTLSPLFDLSKTYL